MLENLTNKARQAKAAVSSGARRAALGISRYGRAGLNAAEAAAKRVNDGILNAELRHSDPISAAAKDAVDLIGSSNFSSVEALRENDITHKDKLLDAIRDLSINLSSQSGINLTRNGLNPESHLLGSAAAIRNLLLIANEAKDPQLKQKAQELVSDLIERSAIDGSRFARFFRNYIPQAGKIITQAGKDDNTAIAKKYSAIADFLEEAASEGSLKAVDGRNFQDSIKVFLENLEHSYHGEVGTAIKDAVQIELDTFIKNPALVLDSAKFSEFRSEHPELTQRLHHVMQEMVRTSVPEEYRGSNLVSKIVNIVGAQHDTEELTQAQQALATELRTICDYRDQISRKREDLYKERDSIASSLSSGTAITIRANLIPASETANGVRMPDGQISIKATDAIRANIDQEICSFEKEHLLQTSKHSRELEAVAKTLSALRIYDSNGQEVPGAIKGLILSRTFCPANGKDDGNQFLESMMGLCSAANISVDTLDAYENTDGLTGLEKEAAQMVLDLKEYYQAYKDQSTRVIGELEAKHQELENSYAKPLLAVLDISYLDPSAVSTLKSGFETLGARIPTAKSLSAQIEKTARATRGLVEQVSEKDKDGKLIAKANLVKILDSLEPNLGAGLADLYTSTPAKTPQEIYTYLNDKVAPKVKDINVSDETDLDLRNLANAFETVAKNKSESLSLLAVVVNASKADLASLDSTLALSGTKALNGHSTLDTQNLIANRDNYEQYASAIKDAQKKQHQAEEFLDPQNTDLRHREIGRNLQTLEERHRNKQVHFREMMRTEMGLSAADRRVVAQGLDDYQFYYVHNVDNNSIADMISSFINTIITMLKEFRK